MGEIIPFPQAPTPSDEDEEIGLMTAVDAAIRDLSDITENWGSEAALAQAEECQRMLVAAYEAAQSSESNLV